MKRHWGIISLLCLLCLVLLTSQVYASDPGLSMVKKTQEPASDQGQPGNGNDKEKQNNDNGNNKDKNQSNGNDKNTNDKTEKENNNKTEPKNCVENSTNGTGQDKTEKIKCDPDETDDPEKDKPTQKNLHLRGTLIAVSANSITLQVGEETRTFMIDPGTLIKIPSLGNKAQWDKLNKGVNILIKAVQQSDESLLVVAVHVIPSKPERVHQVGIVSSYAPGESITIDGTTYKITADTILLPVEAEIEAGDKVTIISPRDVTGGELIARGIVVRQTE